MAKDKEDPSEQIFVAVVAFLVIAALFAYLIYSGTIHDWLTALIAVGSLLAYVVVSTLLAPLVIASAPTKSQSVHDPSTWGGTSRPTMLSPPGPRRDKTPPLAYLFAIVMPGYFIGKTVLWLWGLIFGGGKK